MASEIKRKKTFGSVSIDHINPTLGEGVPVAINIHISFEEALKLYIGLGQLLGHLNGYDRSTTAGRRSAVNLCVFAGKKRITINQGQTGKRAKAEQLQNTTEPEPTES